MVRKTTLKISYEGADITADVAAFLTDFSFTERIKHGETDDVSMSFENTAKLWSNRWFPDRGATLDIVICQENWYQPGDSYQLKCGSFEIDDITDSGPESTFSVGALSVGITSSIRREAKSCAWENIRLSVIARQIAERHGFSLFYDSDYDPVFDRFDQIEESDLEFIMKIAEYAGLNVKLASKQLVIFNSCIYDQRNVSLTLKYQQDGYISHRFRAASADIYTSVQVKYLDPASKTLLTYQYSPYGRSGVIEGENTTKNTTKNTASGSRAPKIDPVTKMVITDKSSTTGSTQEKRDQIKEPKVGKVLNVTQRCKTLKEAEKLARSLLRNKNSRELTGSIELLGNVSLRAGLTLAVEGFGQWDTVKWLIEEVSHSYNKSDGLKTSIELRGVLGY